MEDDDGLNLSAFNMLPKPVINWGEDAKAKHQVRSMEFCEGCLYVGSTDGRVFKYELNDVSDWEVQGKSVINDSKAPGKSLGFGKKPVDSLIAVPEMGQLLVLCHENVTAHKLANLELLAAPKQLKGASLLCVGRVEGGLYVATVRGKKRQLMVWAMDEGVLSSGKEGVAPVAAFATPIELADTPVRMCMCGSSLCVAYATEYHVFKNVIVGPVTEEKIYTPPVVAPYLMTINDDAMLISAEGMAMITGADGMPLPGSPPLMIPGQVPLAYARSRPYVVALFPTHIDVFNVEKQAKVQTIPCMDQFHCLADAGPGARGHGKRVFAATAKTVYCMDPMSFDMQVGMLMGGFHVVQAFDLFRQTLLPGTDDLAAKAAKMRSDAAFCLMADLDFRQAIQHFRRSPIAVQEMLMLVPKLLPKSFSYEPQEEYNPLVKFRCDLEGMVQMALTRHTGNEVTEMSSEELARRAEMVSEELAKAKTMLAEILEFKRDAAAGVRLGAKKDEAEFDDEWMVLAGEAPVQPQPLSEDLLKVIETVLLSLYAHIKAPNEVIVKHLRSAGKRCLEKECQLALTEQQRYTALGYLFEVHDKEEKALNIWQTLGAAGNRMQEEGCDGVVPTVELLARCTDRDVVLKYSEWVLEKNPEEGVRIFAERSPETADLIDTATVLGRLKSLGPHVIQKYLEYIIGNGNQSEEHHTMLGHAYTDAALQAVEARRDATAVREKLCEFLRTSKRCDFPQLLEKIAYTELDQEWVLLYRAMGQHDEALKVVVDHLKDAEQAEAYCLENQPPHVPGEVPTSLFTDLLEIYFHHSDPAVRERATGILDRHATSLDTVSTLKLLPPELSLKIVTPWLTKALQDGAHKLRHLAIAKQLYKMENLRVQHNNAKVGKKR